MSSPERSALDVVRQGPLAWMANNAVAANLLMLVLLVGGIVLAPTVKQEVFPQVDLDIISVAVPYRGATPEDVEQGVLLAIEEAVRGLEGVKRVTATARENVGSVTIELLESADGDQLINDVRSAIERLASLPAEIERPTVSMLANRSEVLTVVLYGDVEEAPLRQIAERARDALLDHPGITQVELAGVRPPEMSVEVPEATLQRYGLTLDDIALAIREANVEVPAGAIRAPSGEVLIRTTQRRDTRDALEEVVVRSRLDGASLRLRDIATVQDAFEEVDREDSYFGQRAVRLRVYRVGDQKPLEVSAAAREVLERFDHQLPPGVQSAIWADMSEIYADRMQLLLKNAYLGLILVLLVLGLFLEIKLAFWVTVGLPIAVMGAFLILPFGDVSINMISLFAFILTLGIVVDDAIVVGEAVYKFRQDGHGPLQAAILGVREVAGPVVVSVLTTIVVFVPMLLLPGVSGKFFGVIPAIVIPVLVMSLIECLFVLPAHLAHSEPASPTGMLGWIRWVQGHFAAALDRLVQRAYVPLLRVLIDLRYFTFAAAIALLIAVFGFVAAGHVRFIFFPRVESDVINVDIRMPFGTSAEETRVVQQHMLRVAHELLEEHGGERITRGVLASLGSSVGGWGTLVNFPSAGSHIAGVAVFLVPMGEREITATEFARQWRERAGDIVGLESMNFQANTGATAGAAVDIELSHSQSEVLEAAAVTLAQQLRLLGGVTDIDAGVSPGKEQIELALRPEARALGLTEGGMARQVRAAFFGVEVDRQQRGRDELRIVVRRPAADRTTEHTLESLRVYTPTGHEVLLGDVATTSRGRSYTQIRRLDGRRVLNVTAEVDAAVTSGGEVLRALTQAPEGEGALSIMEALVQRYPGLSWGVGGEQREQGETMGNLRVGFLLALLVIYALLAVAFRSYLQPAIVMAAIPFGFVGALGGHYVMGYELSFMSIMGIVALSGIVVNSSLIMVDAMNNYRASGMPVDEAVVAGGERRFRPVLLTSLTTFFGLAPMMLETSVQARFLIPMAISLGFGVLFATLITWLVVPSLYRIVEDVRALPSVPGRLMARMRRQPAPDDIA